MISSIISRLVILVFGTLYPAYASYKAVKSQNIKQYVKWMMYWIVFALFTCVETITDVFLSWFPFYYEIKIILVIWLLSPATKGSSFLYRKFVHPMLSSREQEIDEYISKAKEQSYKQVLDLGSKGVNALMQTALKGGGGLVNHIKKSYSLSDLSDRHTREEGTDETDVMITDTRLIRKRHSPRTPSTSMYFSEIDVRTDAIASIQSVEDLSSGYSSGEALANQSLKLQAREGLVRSGSVSSTKARPTRVTRSTGVPKKAATTEDNEEFFDNEDENLIFVNDKVENINNLHKSEENTREIQVENFAAENTNQENVTAEVIEENVKAEENIRNLSKQDEVEKEKSNSSSDDEFVDTEEFFTEGEDKKITGNLHSTTIETTPDTVTNHISESETNLHKVDNSENIELSNQCKKSIENLLTIEDIQCKRSYENLSTIQQDDRGGKYNKKSAPKPPEETPPTITGTLILKPGIIKPLDSNTEVFCNSPKLKRKSPSPKLSKKKPESPLNKLMMLPKKMGFFKHDDVNKRSSWFGGSSSLLNLSKSEYSKSTISLPEGSKEDKRITQQPPERQQ